MCEEQLDGSEMPEARAGGVRDGLLRAADLTHPKGGEGRWGAGRADCSMFVIR
jgi:hypothetical protein